MVMVAIVVATVVVLSVVVIVIVILVIVVVVVVVRVNLLHYVTTNARSILSSIHMRVVLILSNEYEDL